MKTNRGGYDLNGLALCAGVGGLELGLHLAIPEYRCVCYVEREAYAARVLVSRMEDQTLDQAPIWDDVTTFDGQPWRGVVDILSAGFPCQPFSNAGKKLGIEDERWLWDDIARIIGEVGPSIVFLENVPGLARRGLGSVLGPLSILGYDAEWDLFSAGALGAPHNRKRLFILGRKVADPEGMGWRNGVAKNIRTSFGESDSPSDSRSLLADPNSNGDIQYPRTIREEKGALQGGEEIGLPLGCCEVLADPNGEGLLRPRLRGGGKEEISSLEQTCDGFSKWWEVEPSVGRVVDGLAHRVDRVRACGNGVVPTVAARAFTELIDRFR